MKTLFHKFIFIYLHLFILCSTPIFSQQNTIVTGKGKAVVFFEAEKEKPIVKIDSALIVQSKNAIVLDTGKHIISAWAPKRELIQDTIFVSENRTTIEVKKLNYCPEYILYKKNLNHYRTQKVFTKIVPLPVTILHCMFMYSLYNDSKKTMKTHYNNAERAAEAYGNATELDQQNQYKMSYYFERDLYEKNKKKHNNIITASSISIPITIITTAILFHLSKKIQKPIYTEKPLLTINSINFTQGQKNTCSISLNININR